MRIGVVRREAQPLVAKVGHCVLKVQRVVTAVAIVAPEVHVAVLVVEAVCRSGIAQKD